MERLQELGAAVPALKSETTREAAPAETGASAAGFSCARCGKPTGQLPKPPFKGPLGEKIHRHVCNTCWREWILMGTKVINELGLVLSRPEGQQAYDQYMIEFLMLEDRD
ncbi:MAG: hypothetical protein D6788_11940 [Planctomycetota bacterium]|nr:MAG: hypothetical protein D6788_11940 [Planctomycetota bacterium]